MLKKEDLNDYGKIVVGCLLFSFSVNVFVVPAGMYNGGIYGLAQIIRTLLVQYVHLSLPTGFDIAGIINFALNVPLFYIAYRFVSKQFFSRTLFGLVIQTIFISVIPIPGKPVFDDLLLDALIGGLLTGYGLGLILRSKGCSGGVDIIGIYFLKKDIKVTVGKISILVNAVIYLICAAMFDLNIACYSVIYAAIISYTMDRTHYQSINMLCFIITKNKELQKSLTQAIGRGVTYWDGKGAFSAEDVNVNAVVISKYEVKALKRIVNEIDPDAFVFMSEGITVDGYYLKKL
ncbi:MAG: YitT family protein [Lachnospiraceae bacterium]|jgi:uncharacterized membrane-anchored protein YitT (DUF2179 family)|nr:YitT family protein [Lachnospiraceae bacterium]